MFDSSRLTAYLERIGIRAPRRPTLHALRRIHRAHIDAFAYENLDIQLGRPIRLDEDSLFDKLVVNGRGGYCFEQNGTLALALEAMGFEVRRVLGAVARETEGDKNWFNHMPLIVRFPGGEEYLVDAGVGTGFRDPLPLRSGSYRFGAFNFGVWQLTDDIWRCSIDPRVTNLTFDFTVPGRPIEDFAAKCLELSTSPESGFVKTLTVQRPGEDRMTVLRARTLTVYDPTLPEGKSVRIVENGAAFGELLTGPFKLTLGEADIQTLWTKAREQHEQKLAEEAEQASPASVS